MSTKSRNARTISKTSEAAGVWTCSYHLSYHCKVQSSASEEPVNLLGLRVQIDVIETRPGGQTRDCGHLEARRGLTGRVFSLQKLHKKRVCVKLSRSHCKRFVFFQRIYGCVFCQAIYGHLPQATSYCRQKITLFVT